MVSGTYPDEMRDLMVGLAKVADAQPGYDTAHDYFTGDVPEFFASKRLAARVAATGSSFRVNVARKAVTAITDRLEISAVTVPGNETATRVLQEEVWNANELNLEAPDWHERVGEYGDIYAIVWPTDPDTPSAGVDIHFSGPRTTRAIYDPENPRRMAYVIKRWTIGTGERKQQRVNLYYFGDPEATGDGAGRIEKWVTVEGTNGSEATHWRPYEVPGEPWPLANPYGQIVWHFRTARPYGRPLHSDAYGPQDAINKLVVSLMNTVDFHLIPQRAALLDGEAAEDDDDDFDDFGDDDLEASPTDGLGRKKDGLSNLKTGPGELWILRNAKSLVQLPAADPNNFLDPAEFFMRMMAQVNDMPLHMFDPGGDQPSGDSRRQAEGSVTKKVDRLREALEAVWSGLLTKAMQILGYTDVRRVDVRWAPSASVDDREGWETAAKKIEAGVPVGQVLQEMGYEAEQVADWLKANDEQDLKRRIMLLAEVGKAAKDLGTAAGMGVLPPELVAEVIGAFAGARAPGNELEG